MFLHHLGASVTVVGILCFCSPVRADEPALLASSGPAFVTHDGASGEWAIGSGVVTLRLGQTAGGAVRVSGLDGGNGRHWDPAALPDVTVTAGFKHLASGQGTLGFRRGEASEVEGGVRLVLAFEDPANHLRLTRTYATYAGSPGIETWSTFEVFGTSAPANLSDIGVWQLTVPATEVGWVTGLKATALDGGRFTRRRQALDPDGYFQIGSTGRSSETALPVAWLKGPNGHLFAGLLWSGAWSLTVAGPDGAGYATIRVALGDISTSIGMDRPLEGPHAFFGITGDGPGDVAAALQAFARVGVRQGRPISPLVTYNTWYAYGIGITEETLRAEMEHAASLGAELFVVDAGWYAGGTQLSDYSTGIGAWWADARRFPSGLGALSDHAHELGMKFGLWLEPERTDMRTVNRAGFVRESWLAMSGGHYNPGVKNASADTAQVCLASAAAREWVLAQIERLIGDARIDYLKWDNNYWLNCDRSGHGHGAGDGNLAHVKGLYGILATLRERHPDLLIENCAQGGQRLDFGMLRLTDVAWMDDESAPSPHVRHNLEGLTAVFPSEYLLSFVMDHPAELIYGSRNTAYSFRSRLPGALGMSLLAGGLDETDHADMSNEVLLSKQIRAMVQAPTTLLLTEQVNDHAAPGWDATVLLGQVPGLAVLFAFADAGADEWMTIRLQALQPDLRYIVRLPSGETLVEATGADLMADGLQLHRPASPAAQMLILEGVSAPTPLRH